MLRKTSMGALFGALCFLPLLANASPVFINEIHYDNVGSDVGEAVELAGIAGTDLGGWQLLLYNGSNGSVYDSVALDGVFASHFNGYGFLSFEVGGIQNGAPDGLALVDSADAVQQFISYEGQFLASSGLAAGMLSEDIGIVENSSTALNHSLQLTGLGLWAENFSWVLQKSSFGFLNDGQQFAGLNQSVAEVAVPGVAWLILPMLFWVYRQAA